MSTNNNTDAAKAPKPEGYATPTGVFPGTPELYPNKPGFAPAKPCPVGGVILADGDLEYNADRRTKKITVRNTGDRPIQIGSHFHFFEVNRYMELDRKAAFGYHLNIPSTTAIRFEPGEEKEVELVSYAGKTRVIGFNDLVNGYTGLEDTPVYYPKQAEAYRRMAEYGFKDISETDAEAEFTQAETQPEKK